MQIIYTDPIDISIFLQDLQQEFPDAMAAFGLEGLVYVYNVLEADRPKVETILARQSTKTPFKSREAQYREDLADRIAGDKVIQGLSNNKTTDDFTQEELTNALYLLLEDYSLKEKIKNDTGN